MGPQDDSLDSAITNAMIQPIDTMEIQMAHPLKVCLCRWIDFSGKIWKKTARLVTSE